MLQLLNFVVKHKFELFELTRLLSKLLNLVLFVFDGALSFEQFVLHALNVLLFSSGFLQFFVEFILFVGKLFEKLITIILFDLMFVADKHQVRLLLDALVDFNSLRFLVLLLDLLNEIPVSFFSFFSRQFMLLNDAFKFQGQLFAFLLQRLLLQFVRVEQIFILFRLRNFDLLVLSIEAFHFLLLLGFQLIIAISISLSLFELILFTPLHLSLVVFFHPGDIFETTPLNFRSFCFQFAALILPILSFLLDFSSPIFNLSAVLLAQGFSLFGPVSIFSVY